MFVLSSITNFRVVRFINNIKVPVHTPQFLPKSIKSFYHGHSRLNGSMSITLIYYQMAYLLSTVNAKIYEHLKWMFIDYSGLGFEAGVRESCRIVRLAIHESSRECPDSVDHTFFPYYKHDDEA
jgi:hypothetical protein